MAQRFRWKNNLKDGYFKTHFERSKKLLFVWFASASDLYLSCKLCSKSKQKALWEGNSNTVTALTQLFKERENLGFHVTQAAWINTGNARKQMLVGAGKVFCLFSLFVFQNITFPIKIASARRPRRSVCSITEMGIKFLLCFLLDQQMSAKTYICPARQVTLLLCRKARQPTDKTWLKTEYLPQRD